jgi:serine/threonine-protein kinase RsbW
VVRAYVGSVAANSGLDVGEADGVILAAAEASSNVVKHAFGPDEDASFEVICEPSSTGLTVIVRDKGLPFDPSGVERFSPEDVMKGGRPSGLGLFLMEKNVDRLSFRNLGLGGKEVRLVKYTRRKRARGTRKGSRLKVYGHPAGIPKKAPKKIPYHIELLNPSQAIEISQCAYRAYGYNYIFDYIYYPERLIEMNRSGRLVSALAVADRTGEVMSHAALELGNEGEVAELGIAFTKPKFRQQGCLNRLAGYLIEEARKLGMKGLYGRAVTAHPYSQMALGKRGFRDCGILLGLAPGTLFKGTSGEAGRRESIMLLFRNEGIPGPPGLYAPKKHAAMLGRIYGSLGVPAKWEKPENPGVKAFLGKSSEIEAGVNGSLNTADIRVKGYGENSLDECRRVLKELCRKKVDVIDLYLDLRDPLTASLAKRFEEMGFFFAGALPTAARHDLILQYLNNVKIDYGAICANSEAAKELLEYVKANDPNV